MGLLRFSINTSGISIRYGSNSTHLSGILRNNPEIGEMPTLLVFDEFDKCIRPAYGNHGTNYADLLQDNFLKMADGDLAEFGEGGSFIQADFFNVSIVLWEPLQI